MSTVLYLRVATHRSVDNFSVGPVVSAQICNSRDVPVSFSSVLSAFHCYDQLCQMQMLIRSTILSILFFYTVSLQIRATTIITVNDAGGYMAECHRMMQFHQIVRILKISSVFGLPDRCLVPILNLLGSLGFGHTFRPRYNAI